MACRLCERRYSFVDARRRTEKLELEPVLRTVREARQRGFAVLYDAVFPDTGALAVPFPSQVEGFPMAIGVGGLRDRIRRNERAILKAIRGAMARHVGATRPRARGGATPG